MKLRTEKVKFFSTINMDEGAIVRSARKIEPLVGVYFLVRENRVVYVGMSGDVPSRINVHLMEKTKNFDRVFVLECHPDFVRDVESLYITKLRPEYNSMCLTAAEGARAFSKLAEELTRNHDLEQREIAEQNARNREHQRRKKSVMAETPNVKVTGLPQPADGSDTNNADCGRSG